MLSEELRAQGWVEHDGGPCPVPLGASVEYERRGKPYCGGSSSRAVLIPWYDWAWREYPERSADIIAYKPETPDGR